MSGDRSLRFLISTLLSTRSLPVELNLKRGAASPARRSQSYQLAAALPQPWLHGKPRLGPQVDLRPFIEGLSDALIRRAGSFSSRSRSTTPKPRPMLSTSISSGRMWICVELNSAPRAAVSCIRSRPAHVLISNTAGPRRLVSADLSDPERAASCAMVLSIRSIGTTASLLSDSGNSPRTRK